ncbi:BF3164 family lipoprotein [Gracilimonas sp.]|uniref:BF3164 family lipoprotein n=1 Tax=Gracilimonas sp. TaxID=1974203 RepID=UPI0028729C85|nr:BF3164 family lipoprotein [Gracilimonas sp.]
MNKYIFLISALIISILAFVSCNSANNGVTSIKASNPVNASATETYTLQEDNNPINPSNIFNLNNEYLIVINRADQGVFRVYNLPELDYLYSWGRMGRGPDELSFVSLSQINTTSSGLLLLENELAQLKYYEVTDTGFVFKKKANLSYPSKKQPFNNLIRVNDSTYYARYGYDKTTDKEFIALRPELNEVLFTFGTYPGGSDLTGPARSQKYSKVSTAQPQGELFVSFYRHLNRFKIFNYEGNLIRYISINDDYITDDPSEDYIFRTIATSTNEHIYTLGVFNTEEKLSQDPDNFTPIIEIWSWEGKPIKRLKIDQKIHRFAVSDKYETLYGFSIFDPSKIVTYKLDL